VGVFGNGGRSDMAVRRWVVHGIPGS
jgi:hypothetical protein